ncbi:RNB domain-containing ribonuclease [Terriglobus sp.]|uniref:RNB domain-containing ribonuclease n=1 Tax=Terriglobus sp. TaxID=1889013 RepID=UPI003B0060A2
MSTAPHTASAPPPPFDFAAAANAEMAREGFDLTPVPGSAEQLQQILAGPQPTVPGAIDLRALPWSSIDNDTSRDLDQIEWAERLEDGSIRMRIGIADVAATVAQGSPLDQFAARQTQTVYTAARNFPMLPFELSTGLTSLNPGEDRNALVAEYTVAADGTLRDGRIFAATVRNTAQLTYRQIGALLDSGLCAPGAKAGQTSAALNLTPELTGQLCLQAEAAGRIRAYRQAAGALDFRRAEATPVVADGEILSLETTLHNPAMDLIEDLMIAANETAATFLHNAGRSSIRRIVRSPERWARIADLLRPLGYALPAEPDSLALNRALAAQRAKDPDHYPDLALAVIKLMGAGEYVLVKANDPFPPAHFALAAHDYSHTTAPNRRFADLLTQRLVHATLQNAPAPYTDDELAAAAEHCNQQDKAARKVERAMSKRAQAVALQHNIGEVYPAVVTGAGPKGTFVRVLAPPVEGMLTHSAAHYDVGDRLRVRLTHTDPARAFIDFEAA